MKTKEQLESCRVKPSPTAMAATAALVGYEGGEGLLTPQYIEDEHGVYSTGMFHYKGKQIIITIDDGLWHLSASSNHTLGYYELKELRYEFMPDDMTVAQIFPRRESFVNLHENCFHLWQLRPGAYSEEQREAEHKASADDIVTWTTWGGVTEADCDLIDTLTSEHAQVIADLADTLRKNPAERVLYCYATEQLVIVADELLRQWKERIVIEHGRYCTDRNSTINVVFHYDENQEA